MGKKNIIKLSISIILLLCVLVMECMLLPSLISASFINKNTAAYMVFDVEMDEKWNKHTEYVWVDQNMSYKDSINQEWSAGMGDIFLEGYTSDYYVAVVSELISAQTNVNINDVYPAFENSEFRIYTNEFIKMQAGYLVGDNIPPTPNTEKLKECLDKTIENINNESIATWYAENDTVLVSSLKDAMVNSNDIFSADMLEKYPVFGESCLTLKILNILLLFYSLLAFIVIFVFCIIKLCKTKYTWFMLAGAQVVSAIVAIFTYFGLKDIHFVVFGVPYAPTSEMIKDCWPMLLILVLCELLVGGVFIFVNFFGKKIKSRVISKKKA